MTTIAEYTLPPAGFPLGRVFETYPMVTLDLDRVVPSGDTVMPYFWVQSPEVALSDVLQVFETIDELRSITLLEDLGENGLFRAEWEPDRLGIMHTLTQVDVSVVSASGSNHGWLFELRATDREELASFQRHCENDGIEISLARLSHLSETPVEASRLTPNQREALSLAYSRGYYDDPCRTNLETLADELGISRQALSARLRRGYRTLIEQDVFYYDRPDQ